MRDTCGRNEQSWAEETVQRAGAQVLHEGGPWLDLTTSSTAGSDLLKLGQQRVCLGMVPKYGKGRKENEGRKGEIERGKEKEGRRKRRQE